GIRATASESRIVGNSAPPLARPRAEAAAPAPRAVPGVIVLNMEIARCPRHAARAARAEACCESGERGACCSGCCSWRGGRGIGTDIRPDMPLGLACEPRRPRGAGGRFSCMRTLPLRRRAPSAGRRNVVIVRLVRVARLAAGGGEGDEGGGEEER